MTSRRSKNVVTTMQTRSSLLTVAIASILSAAGAASAETAPPPDTSEWTCSKCPFESGYRSGVEAGVAYVDEDSAKFGDFRGLDEKGAYAVVGAEGRAAYESGYVLDYELTDLGLDSREVRLSGGLPGTFDFELYYDAIPHTIFDTTETVYRGAGNTSLTLPPGWVHAGSTTGMTSLAGSLRDVDIGLDRDRYGAAGRYFLGEEWRFSLDYRRDERDGTRTQYASFGSAATELPRPVDDATDRVDARVHYQGRSWYADAGYSLSVYDTKAAFLRWENPFNALASDGQLALAPDNDYHEFDIAAGWFGLPWNTTVGFSAALGQGSQDTGFLPYTINPTLPTDPLPFQSLDGDVSRMRADLTVSSRPIDKLKVRGTIAYDERDNDSRQGVFTSVVHTDLFPVLDDRVNPAYGYERLRLYGSADYDLWKDLTIGVGGEYRETDRTGTDQEVRSEDLLDGWGKVQYRPVGWLGVVLKGGAEERDPDGYDIDVATSLGQNPLMRKYNMAYRYRSYGELVANVALQTLPVTVSASAFYADDSYNFSRIGLTAGLDRRYGVDVAWAINEKVSAYANIGEERIDSRIHGSDAFAEPDWRSFVEDDFNTYGVGVRADLRDNLRVDVNYTYGEGDSETTLKGKGAGRFPTITSELDSLRADLVYGLNERTDLAFTWWYESFDSRDWAIQGIGPATVPTVLSLGADPYDYGVNYVSASVRYYFGPRKAALKEE